MSDLPEITEVQRLTLKPGDLLAIRVQERITTEEAHRLMDRATAMVPEGIKVLILDAGMSLEVVEQQPLDGREIVAAIRRYEAYNGRGWRAS